jgi:Neuraminidase (sialidase)
VNSPEGGGCFWSNVSEDNGVTWSEPENTNIRSGACPRLLKLSDGRLLLTFGRRCPPYGIRAMLSKDGGATWGDTAWILRELDNSNQGYTSSVELGDGRIFTVSYAENDEETTGIIGTFWDLPQKPTQID